MNTTRIIKQQQLKRDALQRLKKGGSSLKLTLACLAIAAAICLICYMLADGIISNVILKIIIGLLLLPLMLWGWLISLHSTNEFPWGDRPLARVNRASVVLIAANLGYVFIADKWFGLRVSEDDAMPLLFVGFTFVFEFHCVVLFVSIQERIKLRNALTTHDFERVGALINQCTAIKSQSSRYHKTR